MNNVELNDLPIHKLNPNKMQKSLSSPTALTPFIVTVKHDKGFTRIRTTASSEDAARSLVCAAEGCPDHAIIRVRRAMYNKKPVWSTKLK